MPRLFLRFWLPALLLVSLSARAQQKQGARWYFGSEAGLDFNYSPPQFDGRFPSQAFHGATICDANGELLFTTVGAETYDRNFQLMSNQFLPLLFYAPILIAQDPGVDEQYYVFGASAVSSSSSVGALLYFKVDMSLRGGLGGLVGTQPLRLLQDTITACLSLLQHANDRDQWLVMPTFRGDTLLAFQLQPGGLSPVRRSPLGVRLHTRFFQYGGGMKSSPNSQWLAVADSLYGVRVFAFNRQTGAATYRYTLAVPTSNTPTLVAFGLSCAFSTDNTKLYVGQGAADPTSNSSPEGRVYQFNLAAPDSGAVQQSRVAVSPSLNHRQNAGIGISDMQLGIDGKLYINASYDTLLSVIDCPNALGAACQFRAFALPLAYPAQTRFNLPSLNQTLFVNAGTFQVQASDTVVCAGDAVRLAAYGAGADQFQWTASQGVVPAATTAPVVVPPLGVTTYQVTGTSACATHTGQVRVRVVARPVVTFSGFPPRFCLNGGLFGPLRGGLPAGPTGRYTGRGLDPLAGTFDPLVAGVGPDTLTYTYTDPQTGCAASASVVVEVFDCLGAAADQQSAAPALLVFPNPATAQVVVRAGQATTLRLFDALGRVVRQTAASAGQDVYWPLADLPAGLYFVRAGATARRLVVVR